WLLTAGEHTRDTQIDELVERAKRVGRDVEGAMKHRVARARNLPERSCARHIDFTGRREDAEHNSRGVLFDRRLRIGHHGCELDIRVAEAAAAWANHDDRRNAETANSFDDRAVRRREPAEEKARTELDAVRAASFGFKGIVDRTAADLEDHGARILDSDVAVSQPNGRVGARCWGTDNLEHQRRSHDLQPPADFADSR